MRRRQNISEKQSPGAWERRGLFLSVAGHALLFYGVVFTFPAPSGPRAPELIFLGSILDKVDFSSMPAPPAARRRPGIPGASRDSRIDPRTLTTVDKPALSRGVKEQRLKFFKPDFSRQENTAPQDPEDMLRQLGIDPTPPQHKPLGLYPP